MSRYKITFDRELLEKIRRMKEQNPGLLKSEASKLVGVSECTLTAAAKRAGMAGELREIFPKSVLMGNAAARKKQIPRSVQTQWLMRSWRKAA